MTINTPKPSKEDTEHALAKAVLSAIPVVGGPAVELFQHLVQPPLERRRNEWMTQVGEKLQELEAQGLNLQDLQNNEQFITAVMQASTAALRTHKAEKLVALRNAVIHIAKGQGPEETIQYLLLSFIDEFILLPLKLRPPSRHGPERTKEVARWQQKQSNRLNGGRPNGAWLWS